MSTYFPNDYDFDNIELDLSGYYDDEEQNLGLDCAELFENKEDDSEPDYSEILSSKELDEHDGSLSATHGFSGDRPGACKNDDKLNLKSKCKTDGDSTKESKNRYTGIKDTSLINMQELFNNSGVVRKFLFGRPCYYNGTHYEYLTEKAFCVLCKTYLDRSVQGQITRMQSYKDLYTYAIEYDSSIQERETKENFYISFGNGVLDAKSLRFWNKHDPTFAVIFTLEADLNLPRSREDAQELFKGTRMYRFLENMCKGDADSMELVLQMMGYLMLNVTPKRAFFWLGPAPASGKSVLMNVISRLFGKSNCCHINAHQMAEKFSQAQLYDCRLNLGLESGGTLNSEAISMIKSLSGDSNISLERKYKSRQDFPNFCKLVFASNEALEIGETDNSDAFWSRCKLIACLQSCDGCKQDHDLEIKLWDEREEWLPAVIYEANKLIQSGFQFVEPEVSKNLKHQWRYMNEHPVATFIRERLEISSQETGFISTQQLLDECVKHTGANLTVGNSFSRLLSKYSRQALMPKKGKGPNGNRVNGFANVQLVDHKEEESY